MTSLYTFILEYGGGTYISPHRGRSPREALARWASGESAVFTGRWAPATVDALFGALAVEPPVALDNVVNAWCVTSVAADKLAILDIVRTEQSRAPN